MSQFEDKLDDVRAKLESVTDRLERHRRVVDGIDDSPETYDESNVEDYLTTLQEALAVDVLEDVDQALEPLEAATDAAAEANLQGATVSVGDQVIEGTELLELDDSPEAMEARLLVESPKVNQLRGGRPRLELPDGRSFTFTVRETHIAEVKEDKTGYLELVLGLE
ncbi:MAG: hypothetical protein ACOCV2_00965 [Persicimonas sp.]